VADAAGNTSNQINVPSFTVVDGAAATAPSVTTNPSSSVTNPTANDLMAQLALLQNQLANAKSAQGSTSSGSSSTKYVFTKALSSGSSGTEVLELQKRLKSEGYLTATPNGNYGPATVAAVKAYQKAKGLSQLGTVGPGTRAALNK
jgi:peptidoglycan hydrolase-like protein with peptidoglycan-binding domain